MSDIDNSQVKIRINLHRFNSGAFNYPRENALLGFLVLMAVEKATCELRVPKNAIQGAIGENCCPLKALRHLQDINLIDFAIRDSLFIITLRFVSVEK
jgi:hypothetical protein